MRVFILKVSRLQAKVKLTKEGRAYLVPISKTRSTLLNGSLLSVGVEKRLMHEDIVMFRGGRLDGGGLALRWSYPSSSHRARAQSKNTSSKKNGKKADAFATTSAVEQHPEGSPRQVNQKQDTIAVSKSRVRWARVVEEIPEVVPACMSAGNSSSKESISPTCRADLLSKEDVSGVKLHSEAAALLPSGSPFEGPSPHGDLFQFLGPHWVPISVPRSPFSL